jgi:hypothetical protein
MNTLAGLSDLELPDDNRLIVTIHYYLPLPFTHQGAHTGGRTPATGWARDGAHRPIGISSTTKPPTTLMSTTRHEAAGRCESSAPFDGQVVRGDMSGARRSSWL